MELSETVFWVLVAINVAWMLFVVVVMVEVFMACGEAITFFRRANAENRAADRKASVKPAAGDHDAEPPPPAPKMRARWDR